MRYDVGVAVAVEVGVGVAVGEGLSVSVGASVCVGVAVIAVLLLRVCPHGISVRFVLWVGWPSVK